MSLRKCTRSIGAVQVITSNVERVRDGSYGAGLITKIQEERFAAHSHLSGHADTGIDVPEVVNLVFMKPVAVPYQALADDRGGTRSHEACKFFDRLPEGPQVRVQDH